MPTLLPKSVNWQLLWGGLEAFVCVGFILGFLAIGRSIQPGTGWLKLSGCVYGVYLFHVFSVVGVQMAIIDYQLSAMLKFLIVTVQTSRAGSSYHPAT
ncbi:hypothetical protein [Marinobacterium jannaschii]|uniref:hypothetical protein n=1 Tax=Marinobacterium jannaschii TaxID=64970 RepID=UPI000B2C022B|nr:hypothetical protein [Marinobacterium jannaschii]